MLSGEDGKSVSAQRGRGGRETRNPESSRDLKNPKLPDPKTTHTSKL